MKIKITIIALLLSVTSIFSQNKEFNRFDIGLSANFWAPSSEHLKATNSITQINIDNNYSSTGTVGGYGTSIAPKFDFTYILNWFNNSDFRK